MYRIEGRRGTYREQRDLAEHLQERGEYGLAERVRRGYDLLPSELSRAAGTFDESGLMRGYEFVVASEYIETDAKLRDAAEQLVRSTDELDVQAGAALSSRLLNARRPLRARPRERTPLMTNRLAERYRLAFQRRRE